jgi:hypothetical protein
MLGLGEAHYNNGSMGPHDAPRAAAAGAAASQARSASRGGARAARPEPEQATCLTNPALGVGNHGHDNEANDLIMYAGDVLENAPLRRRRARYHGSLCPRSAHSLQDCVQD